MSEEIEILASPSTRPQYCFFATSVEFLNGKFVCHHADLAKGSPLLEALWATGEIDEVVVEKNKLLIRKTSQGGWADLAKKVGNIVREIAPSGVFLKKDLVVESEKRLPLDNEVWINQEVVQSPLGRKIRMVLQEKVAPSLAAHGGQVTLVDIRDGMCVLSFSGGCQGCSQVAVTVKEGIERVLKQEFPEVKGVLDATDHAHGANPYYRKN